MQKEYRDTESNEDPSYFTDNMFVVCVSIGYPHFVTWFSNLALTSGLGLNLGKLFTFSFLSTDTIDRITNF